MRNTETHSLGLDVFKTPKTFECNYWKRLFKGGGVTTSSLHRDSESYRIELKISGKLLYHEISRLEAFLDDFDT